MLYVLCLIQLIPPTVFRFYSVLNNVGHSRLSLRRVVVVLSRILMQLQITQCAIFQNIINTNCLVCLIGYTCSVLDWPFVLGVLIQLPWQKLTMISMWYTSTRYPLFKSAFRLLLALVYSLVAEILLTAGFIDLLKDLVHLEVQACDLI